MLIRILFIHSTYLFYIILHKKVLKMQDIQGGVTFSIHAYFIHDQEAFIKYNFLLAMCPSRVNRRKIRLIESNAI